MAHTWTKATCCQKQYHAHQCLRPKCSSSHASGAYFAAESAAALPVILPTPPTSLDRFSTPAKYLQFYFYSPSVAINCRSRVPLSPPPPTLPSPSLSSSSVYCFRSLKFVVYILQLTLCALTSALGGVACSLYSVSLPTDSGLHFRYDFSAIFPTQGGKLLDQFEECAVIFRIFREFLPYGDASVNIVSSQNVYWEKTKIWIWTR